MPFEKGNKLGRGYKGIQGRKSLAVEAKRFKQLERLWFHKHDKEKLLAKYKAGLLTSADEIWLAEMLLGNLEAMKKVFDKIYPPSLNLTQSGSVDHHITHEFIVRRPHPRTLGDTGSSPPSP